ncbi:MAG: amidohydrolase family protein [Alphaproteobacteria bacterium]
MLNFPIIDAHTHVLDARILTDYTHRAPYQPRWILAFHNWAQKVGPPYYTLEQVLAFARQHPHIKVVACINLHQHNVHEHRVLIAGIQEGLIVGIKFLLGYQHFYAHDPRVVRMLKVCQRYDIPAVFHTGDCSARGDPLVKYAHPLHLDELATQCPDVTIVMAHLGFPWLLEAAMVVCKHPNMYADMSGWLDAPPPPREIETRADMIAEFAHDLRSVVRKYPALVDKLMFGTDYSGEHSHLTEVTGYVDIAQTVFRYPDDLAKVMYQNASRAFNLPV